MGLFCRHNRFEADCPICSREREAERRASQPAPPPRTRSPRSTQSGARRSGGASGLRTRKLARAADDGYRNGLVPGLRATVDAERLAGALAAGAARLEFPGPHPAVAEAPDPDSAARLAFALVRGTAVQDDTSAAFEAWGRRSGSLAQAFTGEAVWTPRMRFARLLERLGLPRFPRAQRYELLATLGAAGVFAIEPDALHPGDEDDVATRAAKRLLISGDRRLLERRAADLARAAEVPIGALDHAFLTWEEGEESATDPTPAILRALEL